MQEDLIKAYNQTELSEEDKTPYSRIKKDKHLYIPIKIETAQSRATDRWYTVRYIKMKDIREYIDNNTEVIFAEKKYCKSKSKN